MNDSLSRDERRRRWSREALEISATAADEAARLHVLRLVEEEGFVPYDFQMQAIDALYPPDMGMLPADPYGFSLIEEQAACEAADRFVAEFLELPPQQRGARVEQMQRQLQDSPRAVARLWKLRPLLSLQWPTGASENSKDVLELVGQMARIQTLRPAERGEARRFAYLATMGEPKRWSKAAQRIITFYPSWANLEPGLLKRIVRKKQTAGTRKRAPKKTATVSTAGKNRLVWVAVVGAVLALRAISAFNSSSPTPSYQVPSDSTRINGDSDRVREAIERVNRSIQERREKENQPPPAPPPNMTEIRELLKRMEKEQDKHPSEPDGGEPSPGRPSKP